MRIVVAPNAFKGCMNAIEAAEAMKKGVLAAAPDCEVISVPVADGGDGLTEIMMQAFSGTLIEKVVKGPSMQECDSVFCLTKDLAVIEMARASGLTLLLQDQQDPTQTTTYGTGELIIAALDAGADLVLTAEGQIDFQTKFDKAPAGVARLAKKASIPCIAICGSVGERVEELRDIGIDAVFSLCKGPQSLDSAMKNGFNLLSHEVEQVVRTFSAGRR